MASRRRRLCRAITTITLPVAGLGAALIAMPATASYAQAIGANLKVLSPRAGEALGTTSFSLDVSFHSVSANAPVTTAELWVDGVRWARRDLQTPQVKNVLSFAIDASSLSEGQHTLLVRVVCADGSVGEIVYPVTAGNNAGTVSGGPNGPDLNFRSPNNGRRVMGRVELSIESPAKNGANPFVTIYVDKQFKTLMNMPPYTYTWDTTNVPNGFHTLEATGYLESTNESTTRSIRVLVDNAGGNTEYKKEIPDLSAGHAASAARAVAPTTQSGVTTASKGRVAHARAAKPAFAAVTAAQVAASPVAGFSPIFARGISSNWFGTSTAVSVASPAVIAAEKAPELTAAESALSFGAPVASAQSPSAASMAQPVSGRDRSVMTRMSGVPRSSEGHSIAGPTLVLHFAAPRQVSDVHLALSAPSGAANPSTSVFPLFPTSARAHGSRARSVHGSQQPIVGTDGTGTLHAVFGGKLTTVAFNGQQIAFDVQPRIEGGLPIAPFRQIFEHTGGQVDWAEKTQVVHAVNADKEIVITVGKDQASVNGEMFKMDRAAFVEKGRTIVPLSFVGAALNVKINYDPATGRLEITSK